MCRENDMVGKVCNAQREALCLDPQCLVTPVTSVIPAIGRQRRRDPMGLQASHSNQLMSPQSDERSRLKKLGGK